MIRLIAKLSDGQIAKHIGVTVRMVGLWREGLAANMKVSESTHRAGRARRINTAKTAFPLWGILWGVASSFNRCDVVGLGVSLSSNRLILR